MENLGNIIRDLRQKKEYSLREFADKLKLSAPFISDIELGRRFPSNHVLSKIADLLEVKVDYLLTFDTRPPVEELKRMNELHPGFGFAFRQVMGDIKNKADADDIIKKLNKGRKK
ncbi:MAG: helix-turn-helix transcriptional regulator [Candidatus Komeilibacteria bacterium]|nr:helix-turn-helix transcriptional regulator [Candidatus Komeilibacteria bacterium]